MKKIFLILIILTFTKYSLAAYLNDRTPRLIFGAKEIKFGIDNPPSDSTCNYFGRQFKFDATTAEGKNMYSMLMAAIMSNRKIDIWYIKSTASGKDRNTGCHLGTIAVMTEMGIN